MVTLEREIKTITLEKMKFYEKSYNIMRTMIQLFKNSTKKSKENHKNFNNVLEKLSSKVKEYKNECLIEEESNVDPEFDTYISNILCMVRKLIKLNKLESTKRKGTRRN